MSNKELAEKFTEIFKTKILPQARKLETFRLKEKKKRDFFIGLIIIFVLLILILIFALSNKCIGAENKLFPVVFIISIIMAIAASFMVYRISENFRKDIKPLLLVPILEVFGNFKINKIDILPLKEIKAAGLYQEASYKRDDDIISGVYKDHMVSFIETQLSHSEEEKRSIITIGPSSSQENKSKNRYTVIDFKGLIIKIQLDNFFGVTVAGIEKSRFDLSSIFNSTVYFGRKLEKMNTENINFSSYEIYSDNKDKFENVLTESFSNNLNKIRDIMPVESINFLFKNYILYLFLDKNLYKNASFRNREYNSGDKGFFEVGSISKTLIDKNIYIKSFKELLAIFSVVDCFIKNNTENSNQ